MTGEFVKTDQAKREFKRSASEIDFENIDVAVLLSCVNGEMAMDVLGDLDLVAVALRSALEQVEKELTKPRN